MRVKKITKEDVARIIEYLLIESANSISFDIEVNLGIEKLNIVESVLKKLRENKYLLIISIKLDREYDERVILPALNFTKKGDVFKTKKKQVKKFVKKFNRIRKFI